MTGLEKVPKLLLFCIFCDIMLFIIKQERRICLINEELGFPKFEIMQFPTQNLEITLNDFSVIYIENYASVVLKKRTFRDYQGRLKRLLPSIGHIKLKDFNSLSLSLFFQSLQREGIKIVRKGKQPEGLSPKSIKNYAAMLSSIFKRAVIWGYLKENPMKGVILPTAKSVNKVSSLSSDEVTELINLLEECAPEKYKIFIELDLVTGMRRGEIIGLTWDKINFNTGIIEVSSTVQYNSVDGIYTDTCKTRSSERFIKISQKMVNKLIEYKKHQSSYYKGKDNSYLFLQENGKVMHPNTPYNWFTRFQKANNLRHISIHELRHTTATILICNQVNTKTVSGRLGHSSTKTTTDIYSHYIKEADEFASDVIDKYIFKNIAI